MKLKPSYKIQSLLIHCLIISEVYALCTGKEFLGEIFINECVVETWFIFSGNNPSPEYPSIVISLCHALKRSDFIINHNETTEVKQIAHFTSHAYRLKFVNIRRGKQMEIFLSVYERLMITSIQRSFFELKAEVYKEDYDHYTPYAFELEFLRSRWNIDDITMYESVAAYSQFLYQDFHLPTSLERKMNRHKNITDIVRHGLWYRVISGAGQTCKHSSIYNKLRMLTKNFNAYDRVFCDAFEYFNLPFEGYWNTQDIYWLRGFFVRDDILSAFPPDASQVVYYANPQITFVVLRRQPETWMFIFQPFPQSLWMLIAITLSILYGNNYCLPKIIQHIQRKTDDPYLIKEEVGYTNKVMMFHHVLEFMNGVVRIVIMSCYSGMILFGILYPIYQWTPDTFEELNKTKNYLVCTSKFAPIKDLHLIDNFVLNGIDEDMWIVRNLTSPAAYLSLEFNGSITYDDMHDKEQHGKIVNDTFHEGEHFFAALAMDDKLNLWMKGRSYLNTTFKFLRRIKPAMGKVLSEIRYVSVAPGATRLHFVLDAIKQLHTTGCWMRYLYLEKNYYKKIAPIIVHNMMRAKNLPEDYEESGTQPLKILEVYSVFILNSSGLLMATFVWFVEILRCKKSSVY